MAGTGSGKRRPRAARTPMTRSQMMARVRDRDTAPEMTVRRALWAAGLRYRLHVKGLPGRPDIVLPSRRAVVLVHGCFWHGHAGCARFTIPKTRPEWWMQKIARNRARDAEVLAALAAAGWTAFVVWECQTAAPATLDDLAAAIKAMPRHGRG